MKKLKTIAALAIAGTLAASACIPASAEMRPLPHSEDYYENWYNAWHDLWYEDWYGNDSWNDWYDNWYWQNGNYDEWIDEWDGSWDASDLYYYDYLIEAEEYPYYYPASDAEILHDGHGNFTVSGSASGAISSDDPFTTVIQPSTTGSTAASNASGGTGNSTDGYPDIPAMWQGQPVNSTAAGGGSYTSLSIPAGQRFGTLTINGKQIGVYEGTTDSVLLRGAGHFTGTSAWDGNACFAGHNRGPNAWFYDLISLRTGDAITYSTSLGTRTYRVSSIRTVSVNDLSPLNFTDANQLTLVTCLANQPSVRLIVTAVQI